MVPREFFKNNFIILFQFLACISLDLFIVKDIEEIIYSFYLFSYVIAIVYSKYDVIL